jgi:hypothetical protein
MGSLRIVIAYALWSPRPIDRLRLRLEAGYRSRSLGPGGRCVLLRRMIEHVRAQNWTAVAIDFVIVVVGVFIGIQVANWNDRQAAKRRGADYAQRLVVDLSSDLAYRRAIAGYYESVLQSASTAVVLLASAQPNPTELVVNTYRATEFAFTPQTRSTWDEIVSSGEIGLLPRAAVERGLAFYYGANAADLAARGHRRLAIAAARPARNSASRPAGDPRLLQRYARPVGLHRRLHRRMPPGCFR